jgi:tRNA1Val (adenine37-N6)-methyltransferase
MSNTYFQFKQFTIQQDACAMKVCTDACLFGAWCAAEIRPSPTGSATLLDIGTGTGLLSLMVLQKHRLLIDAVEIDGAAAEQAAQNANAAGLRDYMNVINTDIQRMTSLKKYDYIISNPPFYHNDLKSPDSNRNTAHHSSGLSFNALFDTLATQLKESGHFFLLLPYKRKQEMEMHLEKHRLYSHKEISVRQTPAHPPFRILLKGSREPGRCAYAEITIAAAPQQYTPEFTALLRDYYLYL